MSLYTLGIPPRLILSLKVAYAGGATVTSRLDAYFSSNRHQLFRGGRSGRSARRDYIAALIDEAERLNFGQIAFAKLGPDYDEAINLLRHRVLPV